jgi:hypothetical protein
MSQVEILTILAVIWKKRGSMSPQMTVAEFLKKRGC